MLIQLTYPGDFIFQLVKQESSLLAVRRTDKEGNPLFQQMVFDEAYMFLFHQLFLDAQAEVTPVLSAYIIQSPAPEYIDDQDLEQGENYTVSLNMPDDFMRSYTSVINTKIKEFFIAHIMYRWLETKLPQEAATYLDRAQKALSDIKSSLERRTKPVRIKGRLF